ncbi:Alpha-L-fucosidase [Novipirellula aureliae]|uniref:alpha-L-fucosidase n=1 Tax=Novipirellula aureliae TaxID=2527966 RepID=A0A5C6E740_9BACT|nr:alpha-L-fucosidase [Novipirellula aureliae]TWU44375.1 Alpha-L-fucosidase [Novipirellula aureliae]
MISTIRIRLSLACVLMVATLSASEVNYAEDPFALEQGKHVKTLADRPWADRSPEELQQWARENLHRKLIARKVIDANEHPEWEWFRKSGLGIFLHWGLPSANPDTGDAWAIQWNAAKARSGRYMEPATKMFAVAETWNPDKYDPNKWMAAASKAGFGYAVLTARHHDGYALWPSQYGSWHTGEYMGGRDLIKDYVEACRKNRIKVGFYYSGPSWHFAHEQKSFGEAGSGAYYNHKMEKVIGRPTVTAAMAAAEKQEAQGQVRELMQNYGPIDVMWWDGSVAMKDEELATMQPTVLVARGNIATPEGEHQGASENVKVANECGWWWEECRKSENSFTPNWHYGIECERNHWDTNTLLAELIRCRSLGGNLLVNVPPRGNGEMMDWFYDVCDEMAGWMKHSREAIYDIDLDAPLPTLDKTQNYTTVRGRIWYAMPNEENTVFIHELDRPTSVTLLRTGVAMDYEYRDGSLRLVVPKIMQTDLPDMVKIVFAEEP